MSNVTGLRRVFLAVLSLSCIFFSSCAKPTLYVAPSFQKDKYHSVGLLVTRVGNRDPDKIGSDIPMLNTDYSIRIPASGVPLYIEEENRLLESFPFYPKTAGKPFTKLPLGPLESYEFYGNITPKLYQSAEQTLVSKGYRVVDIQKLSRTWEKAVSESTVGEIIQNSGKFADAIVLIQYMDTGQHWSRGPHTESIKQIVTPHGGGIEYKGSIGEDSLKAIDIAYNVTMFDCMTKEMIVSFRKDSWPPLWITIRTDPDLKKEVTIKEQAISGLTQEEQVEFAIKYIMNGLSHGHETARILNFCVPHGTSPWTGLKAIIP